VVQGLNNGPLPTCNGQIECIGISIPHGGKIKRTFNGNCFIPYIWSVGVLDSKIKSFFLKDHHSLAQTWLSRPEFHSLRFRNITGEKCVF
jgi:hypothetical protein